MSLVNDSSPIMVSACTAPEPPVVSSATVVLSDDGVSMGLRHLPAVH